MSLDRVTEMPRVHDGVESLAGLYITVGQPDLDTRYAREESSHLLANPNDPKPTEYVMDQIAGRCGTEIRTEYKVHWYR